MSKNPHIILIDGYGFVFRAYHAVPPFTRDDGVHVGAVYGFTSMLMKIMNDIKSTHAAVIFDAGKKTFRNTIYPEYKAHRPPAPDDLIPQFAIVREAARALNLAIIEQEGYEADDIIATLTNQALNANETVTIVSSDKDLMQLIDDRVSMYDPMKLKFIKAPEVFDKFGVAPSKVIDVLSMIGDASDNIPGIPGIGPKIAAELINEFNSLEELFTRTAEIKQNRRREMVETNIDLAKLSKQLITLHNQVPISLSLSDLSVKDVDLNILLEFLKAQNFKSLIARATKQFTYKTQSSFAFIAPQNIDSSKNYQIITTEEEIIKYFNHVKKTGYVSVYLQTELQTPIGLSLSNSQDTYYIPINFSNQQSNFLDDSNKYLPLTKIKIILQDIFNDKAILKIFYNHKDFSHLFDSMLDPVADILLMSYSLSGTSIDQNLEELAGNYLGMSLSSITELTGTGKNKSTMIQVEIQKLANYACVRAESIFKIHQILKQELFKNKLLTIYEKLERPLSAILHRMEKNGILVDKNRLNLMSKDFGERIAILEREIFTQAGSEFNIGSPKQLSDILFNQMNIKPIGKISKTGSYGTGADILEDLAHDGHMIANLLLEWRGLSKLKNTYTDGLAEQVNPNTGRIHTNFSMASTATGRLSSTNPNLQNIPIRSVEGTKIRSCFTASLGYKLISADYSQIELRILAHMANIESLKSAFTQNRDIHTATAMQIFGITAEEVDSNMRRKAKAINFGIIYGISSFGLAKQLSISRADASIYIKKYFQEYPGIEQYMRDTIDYAKAHGYVKTLMGRKCFVKGITDANGAVRSFSERAAINAPIQGTAADIIKNSMVKLQKILDSQDVPIKMLLQVHDELLFEVKEEDADYAASIIKKAMEEATKLDVKLTVDIGIGDDWAELH